MIMSVMSSTKITYQIFPENKIILEKYIGVIYLEDYSQMKEQQFTDVNYRSNYNVIADFRNATFPRNKPMTELMAFFTEHKDRFSQRKSALLVNTPNETSQAFFFSHSIGDAAPIYANVFSTMEAAFHWLGIFDKNLLLKLEGNL